MSTKPALLICLPHDMGPGSAGSTHGCCATCGAAVSIAPSGQTLLLRGRVGEVRCLRYLPSGGKLEPMQPEQRAELPGVSPELYERVGLEMIGLAQGLPLGAKRGQA